MDLHFVVHTAIQSNVPATVQFQGEEVKAQIDCLEVELLPVNKKNGSLTVRFTGADISAAKELFTVDRLVTASFKAAE